MAKYSCGCGHSVGVPTHCGKPMEEKEGKLACGCGSTAPIPKHCGTACKREA